MQDVWNILKKKQISAVMVKHFLLLTLLYPLYSSGVGTAYAPNVIYANVFVVMFTVLVCLEGNIDWKRKSWLGYAVALSLVGFNVFAFYGNWAYFGWYAGQINMSIAFLFFLAWLLMKDSALCMNEQIIKFLLGAVGITNLISLIPGILNCNLVLVDVNGYDFLAWGDDAYSWIFSHKSEYSLVLVLSLALTWTYRRLYAKKWMLWGSIGVCAAGLVIANTRATMLAALFILAGVLFDDLVKRNGKFHWRYLLWLVPFALIGVVMLWIFSKKRDVFTLGLRTYIWKGSIDYILDNPWGISAMCGVLPIPVEEVSFAVRNCHNVFLNYLLQFSIPAGAFCILIWLGIIVASIWKNRSLTTLGIWVALLIPMNMDWSILIQQTPLAMILLFFIFFHPLRNGAMENT